METKKVPVRLENGSIVRFEISQSGRQEVGFNAFSFEEIASTLEGISSSLKASIAKAKPQKASIKFGMEIGIEAGKITSAIVQGTSKANLEVTLEWEEPESN